MKNIFSAYLNLTKLYAVVMIVFVAGVSYAISFVPGESLDPAEILVFSWLRLLHLVLGIGIAGSGALALNQYMERASDQLMERTKDRPLPKGELTPQNALFYGHLLMWGGYMYLAYYVNGLCALATFVCGMSYLYLYTPMKMKSSLSTFFGSIPGAMLPIMGWLGKYQYFNEFDIIEPPIIILLLSLILFLWQIPHALIIAIRYKSDYEKAGMKQLPLVQGDATAFRHIYLNLWLLMTVSLIPFFNETIPFKIFAIIVIVLHLWLIKSFYNFVKNKEKEFLIIFYRRLMIYLPSLLTTIILFNELSRWSFHFQNWLN